MTESDFYPKISAYYERIACTSGVAPASLAVEVKITKSALPFSALQPHQELALLQAERALAYKIADVGLAKKPFDLFVLRHAVALVVVVFLLSPRTYRVFEIPVRAFIREKHASARKSLTLSRAGEIGREIFI